MARSKVKANLEIVAPTEEQIRIAAYLNWEAATGGNPVDEETSRKFWFEAEQKVSKNSANN